VFRARGHGEYCTSQYTRVRGHGHGLHVDETPVVIISIEVRFPDGRYATVAETVLVSHDGPVFLTGPRPGTPGE
jgi:hypothetical protein